MTATKSGLLRDSHYLPWLISDTTKGLAAGLSGFAIPLLVLIITDSPSKAGLMAGIATVIRLIATLAGGVLADRRNRVVLMGFGAIFGVVISGGFVILVVTDQLSFVSVFLIQCCLALRAVAFDVAGESALKEIIPTDAQGRAQAANGGRDAALTLIGGPLGGFLLGIGTWAVGVVMTISYLLSAVTAGLLGRKVGFVVPSRPEEEGSQSAWEDIREGFSWLIRRNDLVSVMVVTTLVNLGFTMAMTTTTYSLQQAGYEPVIIGTISTAIGAAMLVGALFASVLVSRLGTGKIVILGLAVASLCIVGLTAVNTPLPISIILAVAVLLLPAMNAAMMGYFMVATPSEVLGRVNSTSAVISMGAMPLSPLLAGFGLDLVGRGWTMGFAATLMAIFSPSLRSLPKESAWASHSLQFSNDDVANLDVVTQWVAVENAQ